MSKLENMAASISVIIPTYNQDQFLSEAINSVLTQTHPAEEIIVVNDGSTDRTAQVLSDYKRVANLSIIHQKNQGLSAARNSAISQAKGSYIALLDSDDVMEANRLEVQWKYLQKHHNIDILYTSVTLINETGRSIGAIKREKIPSSDFLAEEFFRNQIPSPSTLFAHKRVFDKCLFDPHFVIGEDWEWTLRAAHHFVFEYLDIPLTKYRRHGAGLSEKTRNLRTLEYALLRDYGIAHIMKVVDRSSIKDKDLHKGKILFIMEEYPLALTWLEKSCGDLSLFYQGNCYFQLGQFKKALTFYERAIEMNAENATYYNNLGVVYLRLEEADKASLCFDKAKILKPEYQDPVLKSFTRRELRQNLIQYQPRVRTQGEVSEKLID